MKFVITVEAIEDHKFHIQLDDLEKDETVTVVTTSPIQSVNNLLKEQGVKGKRGRRLGQVYKKNARDGLPF